MPNPANGEIPVLGDFELRREIGRGGMGTVYEAWQRSLQRTVAIKILASHVGLSDKAITRFQREAQAAAKLHHINIVQIFAQGEIDGIYFYAMELVDGQGINCLIAANQQALGIEPVSELAETVALPRDSQTGAPIAPAPPASTTTLKPRPPAAVRSPKYGSPEFFRFVAEHMAAVADALDYAHSRGIVHRDIKPHNLLLGSDGRIQVSDFGLARLSEQPGVTQTGELVGSPLYMSPEQITGDFAAVDHRTDIYSLGATLYEWLTLRPPYPGETRERVIGQILSSEAIAPRQHNAEIPHDLETVVLKAIERDPHRRYQHARELRDDLRRFLGQKPVLARRASLVLRGAKFVRRHQAPTFAAAAIVLVLTLAWALWTNQQKARSQEKTVAALEQVKAEAEQFKKAAVNAETLKNFVDVLRVNPELLTRFGASALSGAVDRTSEATRALSAPAIGSSLSIATGLSGAFATSVMSPTLLEEQHTGLTASALREWKNGNFQGAKALIDEHLAQSPDDLSAIQLRAAMNASLQDYENLLRDAERLAGVPEYSAIGQLWRGLAQLLSNKSTESISELSPLVADAAMGKWARVLRGLAYIQNGSMIDAVRDFDAALVSSPDFVPAHLGLAALAFSSNDFKAAAEHATRAIDRDQNNADALTIRGDSFAQLGNLQEAARDYEKALSVSGWSLALLAKLAAVKELPNAGQPAPAAPIDGKALMPPASGADSQPRTEPVSRSSAAPQLNSSRQIVDGLLGARFRIP